MGELVESQSAHVVDLSTTQVEYARPTTGTERKLAEVLAEIVGTERVSAHSNFFDDLGADSLLMAQFCARVRKRPDLPTVSMKDVYRHPTISGLATALGEPVPAPGDLDTEKALAEILAEIVGVEHVSADSNFFDDLGADSLLMARFCARVRKRPGLPTVSIQDVYAHPTVKSLATTLAKPVPAPSDLDTEKALAEILAEIVGVEHVSADSNFFDDLGADSLLMARFCARVRKRPDLPTVSIQDVYAAPDRQEPRNNARETRAGSRRVADLVTRGGECRRGGWSTSSAEYCSYWSTSDTASSSRSFSNRATTGSPTPPACPTSTCDRSCSERGSSSAFPSFRSWRNGCSSVGGSPGRSASGA